MIGRDGKPVPAAAGADTEATGRTVEGDAATTRSMSSFRHLRFITLIYMTVLMQRPKLATCHC